VHVTALWMGTCHETGEHLSEHLEGELRGLRRLRVVRHLERCELCRAVLQSLIRMLDELRSLAQPEASVVPSVVPAVVSRIREGR
jgi:predicted anti-sigma-YlaC factor YlaD